MEEEGNQTELEIEKDGEKEVIKEWATPLKANKKGGNGSNSVQPFNEEQINNGESPAENGIGFLEAIGGVFMQPIATFKEVGRRGSFLWGIIIIFLAFLLDAALRVAFGGGDLLYTFEPFYASTSLAIFYLAIFPLVIGFSVAYAAILYALANFFGGSGRFQGFFASDALAFLPTVFIALLQPLFKSGGTNLIFTLLKLMIMIWVFVLQILAIRETLNLTTGKAALVYFLPMLFLLVSVFWMLAFGMFAFPGWGEFF